jgi:hypothetical protein
MTIEKIQQQYIKYAGYNAWADANDIVILYPQVRIHALTKLLITELNMVIAHCSYFAGSFKPS